MAQGNRRSWGAYIALQVILPLCASAVAGVGAYVGGTMLSTVQPSVADIPKVLQGAVVGGAAGGMVGVLIGSLLKTAIERACCPPPQAANPSVSILERVEDQLAANTLAIRLLVDNRSSSLALAPPALGGRQTGPSKKTKTSRFSTQSETAPLIGGLPG